MTRKQNCNLLLAVEPKKRYSKKSILLIVRQYAETDPTVYLHFFEIYAIM